MDKKLRTLLGYQQATDKRTNSRNSGKSSGYASHVTGMHHVSEKRAYREVNTEFKFTKISVYILFEVSP